MTKILGGNSFPRLLKSSEMEMNESVALKVTDFEMIDFGDDREKPVLTGITTIQDGITEKEETVQFALNYVNSVFLVEHGFTDYEDLIGKTLCIKKEARVLENTQGKKYDSVGLFIKEVKA